MPGALGRTVGRYAVYDEIASGGMASVHVGRLLGPVGFSRTVAVKCMHPQFAKDPEFVAMFLDEARLAARIRHPNVVATIDVVALEGEIFLVMDYVQGEPLSRLVGVTRKRGELVPPAIASAIVCDALAGLHAVHEATTEQGEPLHIVHRDVSPQNLLVGTDGAARVLDFGVAKAASRVHTTREGALKGKLGYMSPEQLTRKPVDRRSDVFATAIVLWEALTGARLFSGEDVGETVTRILTDEIPKPSSVEASVTPALDAVVMKGLARDLATRYASAREMALALEAAYPPARPGQVGEWVEQTAEPALSSRAKRVAEIESFDEDAKSVSKFSDQVTMPTMLLDAAAQSTGANAPNEMTEMTAGMPTLVRSPRRSRRAPAVVVAVAGLAAVAVFSVRAVKNVPTPASAAASAATSADPSPAVVGEAPAVSLEFDPSTSPTDAPPTVPASTSPPPLKQTPVPPRGPRAPHSKEHHPDCDPPYYFDGNQVKRFKPGCLY